jgi:hypothetical protein
LVNASVPRSPRSKALMFKYCMLLLQQVQG